MRRWKPWLFLPLFFLSDESLLKILINGAFVVFVVHLLTLEYDHLCDVLDRRKRR